MNIIPKHDAHATVASFDSQYLHCGASDEIAAPQFGQLRVFASIPSWTPEYQIRVPETQLNTAPGNVESENLLALVQFEVARTSCA